MRGPPFRPTFHWSCFLKGAATAWDEGKAYTINSTQWTTLDEHCSPCHSRLQRKSFTTSHVKTFSISQSIQNLLVFLTMEADIGRARRKGPCSIPRHAKRSLLFFSHASFSRANIGRCKIMCPVSVLRLWTCSFCFLSWNIILPGKSTFADAKMRSI